MASSIWPRPLFTKEVHSALHIVMNILAKLQVPVSFPKLEGPCTTNTISLLGILIDTACMELQLPHERVFRLRSLVASMLGRRSGQRSEVELLPGHLSHTAVFVTLGKLFCCCFFSAATFLPHG